MEFTVKDYADRYRVSKTCVRTMVADGRLNTKPSTSPLTILVPPGHKPPVRYAGNPNFSNTAYQRDLAQRPRPGRRRSS